MIMLWWARATTTGRNDGWGPTYHECSQGLQILSRSRDEKYWGLNFGSLHTPVWGRLSTKCFCALDGWKTSTDRDSQLLVGGRLTLWSSAWGDYKGLNVGPRHRRSSRAELPSSRAELIPGPVGLNAERENHPGPVGLNVGPRRAHPGNILDVTERGQDSLCIFRGRFSRFWEGGHKRTNAINIVDCLSLAFQRKGTQSQFCNWSYLPRDVLYSWTLKRTFKLYMTCTCYVVWKSSHSNPVSDTDFLLYLMRTLMTMHSWNQPLCAKTCCSVKIISQ
jgi:hypothetical protein